MDWDDRSLETISLAIKDRGSFDELRQGLFFNNFYLMLVFP